MPKFERDPTLRIEAGLLRVHLLRPRKASFRIFRSVKTRGNSIEHYLPWDYRGSGEFSTGPMTMRLAEAQSGFDLSTSMPAKPEAPERTWFRAFHRSRW